MHVFASTLASACQHYDQAASGSAGHVLLEYKSGGKLLTSATHWSGLLTQDFYSDKKNAMIL
jgi:hypothetical protein